MGAAPNFDIAEFIALRRDLHQHPELGFDEHHASDIVANALQRYGPRLAAV